MEVLRVFRNVLAILGVIFIGVIIYSQFHSHIRGWNKESGVDLVQQFNVAYLMMPDGTVQKFMIKSWRDYELSDQIQFTTTNDVTYLTHASRMILTNEKDK